MHDADELAAASPIDRGRSPGERSMNDDARAPAPSFDAAENRARWPEERMAGGVRPSYIIVQRSYEPHGGGLRPDPGGFPRALPTSLQQSGLASGSEAGADRRGVHTPGPGTRRYAAGRRAPVGGVGPAKQASARGADAPAHTTAVRAMRTPLSYKAAHQGWWCSGCACSTIRAAPAEMVCANG